MVTREWSLLWVVDQETILGPNSLRYEVSYLHRADAQVMGMPYR